jgi:HAD superfamily hydrolase (TIGR01509 family)
MSDPLFSESLLSLESRAAAFLFDCDGTLVDTMGAHHRSWSETLRAVTQRPLELDYERFCALGGMSGHQVALEISAWFGLNHDLDDLLTRKRDHFMSLEEVCPPIAPVADFARRIACSHKIAVVSGGHRSAVERSLLLAGLRDLFPVVVTPEDVLHGKPAPDMYLLAAKKLGVAPSTCVVVEDGPPGVDAAVAAGMHVVGIGAAAIQRISQHRENAVHGQKRS